MEVHAHSHTPRRKWTHYFWEFIMLFLAVFCGFLAENQREHYVEHQREKQFIRLLIYDIEADTLRLNGLINQRTIRESYLDSLTLLLNNDSAENKTNQIYFFAQMVPRITVFQFTPNDGNMQQLKNSGGLRLIRKLYVADSIIKYDAAIRSLLRLDQQEQDIIMIQREVAPRLFNGLALSQFSDRDNNPVKVDFSPPLQPGFENALNEFNYRLYSVKNVNKGYRRESKKLLKQATNLIALLKKEYRIK